ncbi:hypothetical protein JHK85_032736 [Glycine max]|nr:hypothetical protein JHK85_032736 [Glycine max]
MQSTRVKKHSVISENITGWHSTVGEWASVYQCIIQEGALVGDDILVHGASISRLHPQLLLCNILLPDERYFYAVMLKRPSKDQQRIRNNRDLQHSVVRGLQDIQNNIPISS